MAQAIKHFRVQEFSPTNEHTLHQAIKNETRLTNRQNFHFSICGGNRHLESASSCLYLNLSWFKAKNNLPITPSGLGWTQESSLDPPGLVLQLHPPGANQGTTLWRTHVFNCTRSRLHQHRGNTL